MDVNIMLENIVFWCGVVLAVMVGLLATMANIVISNNLAG